MRKIALYMLTVSLALGTALPSAFAETSTSSLISQLAAQIEALKTQLAALHAAQTQVASSTASVTSTVKLLRSLRQGMTGDDVKALQAILAADPTVYPEGLISGYFGGLTAQAVKRFQKKNGIEQLGLVGPKTLKALNRDLDDNELSIESAGGNATSSSSGERENEGKRLCVIVPPGHLIAPGWLRKHEGEDKPIVPECQKLPPGIQNILNQGGPSNGTTTSDKTAPSISSVTADTITSSSATVHWTTNENASSQVWYATSTPVNATDRHTAKASVSGLVMTHAVALSSLSASTAYHFIVVSTDAAGNTATSSEANFSTIATVDTTAPVISSVASGNLTANSASISWLTDELSTSKVWYATSTPVAVTGTHTMKASISGTTLSHVVPLSGLSASTGYFYLVVSADASNNIATSTESSFTTTP